jgi:eukaryotic-like serine/threonine-protein kinase
MTGSIISHYRVDTKLGEGGMGVVYKAEDLRLQRTVALKFLSAHSVEERHKQRFFEEARNAALLQHPNICPIYEVDEVDGTLFFAMAYLEGKTVWEKLANGRLTIGESLNIAIQVADGLEEAHLRGIVHRDIKSGNIIVSAKGHAYILDFGLALRDGGNRLTVHGSRVGTPAYMSPEQAQGLAIDQRTDLWSLGVVLFEMLTGKLPFHRDGEVALVHAIIYDQAPMLKSASVDASPELERVLERCLTKDPVQRWQRARDIATELRRIQGTRDADPTRSLIAEGSALHPSVRSRRSVLIAAAAIPAVAVAAYFGRRWLPFSGLAIPAQSNIAVLPFQVIGGDQNLGAITDGLVEVVTAKLSGIDLPGNALIVPASEIRSRRISSPAQARRICGANLVITGSAQLLKQMVTMTVALVDPGKMRQLRGESFSLDVDNPIALRDHALSSVLGLMQVQLSQAEGEHSARGDSSVPAAYADYLKGAGCLARYDVPGKLDLALANFQSALRQDPNYALAYAGLAGVYKWKAVGGDKQWAELAIQNAERAVQLQPGLAATHETLGTVYSTFGREDEAIKEFQSALKISPGNGEVYRDLAEVLENLGRYTEAEAMYQESLKKRPGDWYGHLLIALFLERRRRNVEAEAEFERAIQLTPDNPIARRTLAGLYRIEGRYPDAVKQLENALTIEPTASLHSALSVVYFFQHRYPEAEVEVKTAIDLQPGRYVFWGNLGMIYQQIPGKTKDMQEALRRALELGRTYTQTTPKDYSAHADLAEYHARLREVKEATAELDIIPNAVHDRFLVHLALVYELIGQRRNAIQSLIELPPGTSLSDVQNDPALQRLWADPELQSKLKNKQQR